LTKYYFYVQYVVLIKERVINLKIIVEKRYKVAELPNYITVRSKQTAEVPVELLRENSELIDEKSLETIVRIDLIRIPIRTSSTAQGDHFDAIVVEYLWYRSTAEAYKIAESLDKDKWEIHHMNGTENWNKESSED